MEQSAVPRKVDIAVRPQSQLIVLSDGIQGVIGPAMGVAAAVAQRAQLAQHGEGDGSAQGRLELGHRSNFFVLQKFNEAVSRVSNDVHNVNITPNRILSSVIFTFRNQAGSGQSVNVIRLYLLDVLKAYTSACTGRAGLDIVGFALVARNLFMHES